MVRFRSSSLKHNGLFMPVAVDISSYSIKPIYREKSLGNENTSRCKAKELSLSVTINPRQIYFVATPTEVW